MSTKDISINPSIIVQGQLSQLHAIRQFILSTISEIGIENDELSQIVVAVDEACTNIIRYGYKEQYGHELRISVHNTDQQIAIHIMDCGEPFNPQSVNAPNMKEYFTQCRSGGLGIALINKVMDSINYKPASQSHHWNTLILTKTITG